MIAQRFTYRIKPGAADRVIEMIHGEETRSERQGTMRVYQCTFGPGDTIAMELDFEDMAELQAFWQSWFARPTTPAFFEEWNQIVKHTVSNEVWDLV